MAGDFAGDGFGEGVQRAFALDDAPAFRRMMLGLYGARCALMGEIMGSRAEDGLDVFLFQPLAHGGVMTTGNAIVVDTAVASLLGKGLILINDDYEAFLPHPEVVGADLRDAVSARTLRLPGNVALWPDRAMLSYHRSLFRAQ